MKNGEYGHFVCLVAGDNPDELMKEYGPGDGTKEYIIYKLSEAIKIQEQAKQMYNALIEKAPTLFQKFVFEEELDVIKDETPIEYFSRLTQSFKHNPETGDAISNVNPSAKYTSYRIGKELFCPFMLKNGNVSSQALKGDVNWEEMHLGKAEKYDIVWDTVIDGKKPKTDTEKLIYNNMKHMKNYLLSFGNKEKYVSFCTSFWTFAFLSKETGWVNLEPETNQMDWVICFFEKFIVPLSENTLLTQYECTSE